ncbi:MAG TPA: M10 family metallopeptidase C-terminal domain-containing protein [Pararhizobium sp.]|uniref:M10 family metallopeptidase C-terminal domain-containing protein n=1 Tax=Pararhizobium sp. TaxID=1977563 RepID=UPI002D0FE705|nr:M10 family metallopeptidase C-terminal domain-containing protein [Pararhizobium sp.]HTO30580.1 M10 family metallopeptidase C-terminal domain-containing protein [Pararhizobium sp.]
MKKYFRGKFSDLNDGSSDKADWSSFHSSSDDLFSGGASFSTPSSSMIPFDRKLFDGSTDRSEQADSLISPTQMQEVSFLTGLNPDGTVITDPALSFWSSTGRTAQKWGGGAAGTEGTITYKFDAASNLTASEKAVYQSIFALWESVADVHFVEDVNGAATIRRGNDGGAYVSSSTTTGSGSTVGTIVSSLLSIDNSQTSFELTGSFDTVGGYGINTIIHEVGHLLGLGHGGTYNGAVSPSTQQYSAYDDRQYTIMSYIFWADTDGKYFNENPNGGTNWGATNDSYYRQAPHTMMMLDIQAIQQLYGASDSSPLGGGQTYGFNTNIAGPIARFFDFTENTSPVVTLFNLGVGNTLDVSGYSQAATINLNGGAFSSVGGLINNVAIAAGTRIDTAIGGSGNDTINGNSFDNTLNGGAGADNLDGGIGNDRLDGGIGVDTMTGGIGDDHYIVNNAGDVINEVAGGGTADRVSARASYVLAADDDIELLTTVSSSATTAINLTGNALHQDIIGNSGNNTLRDGAGAADLLKGLAGNDTYQIYTKTTTIVETGASDTADRVMAGVDYTLGAGVRVEIMTTNGASGLSGIDLTGNEFVQAITGNAGNNILNGKGGSDTLKGLGGLDTFVFNTALGPSNVDKILDFNVADDTIKLENAIFTALTSVGTLAASLFKDNFLAPRDANDKIIYNSNTGSLFYDADGLGSASTAVKFASLTTGLSLTASDFIVI